MAVTARASRRRPLAVLALSIVAALAFGPALPASAEGAPAVGSSITLTVDVGGPVATTVMPVVAHARIWPADTSGTVTFMRQGQPIAEVSVVGGEAQVTIPRLPAGSVTLSAGFTPADPTVVSPAMAVPITVVVVPVATVSLAYSDGRSVPAGTELSAGQSVVVEIEGFPARTVLALSWAAEKVGSLTTDATGAARARLGIPREAGAGTYLLAAAGGDHSASVVVTVGASSTPSPSPSGGNVQVDVPASPSPAPTDSTPTLEPGPSDQPSTGGSGELAHTGADPVTYVLLALLLVGVGAPLTMVPARPVGRHQRR